jgi:DNA-binding beta-propeller fold protein YncE
MRKLLLLATLLAGCWDETRPVGWTRTRTVLGPIPLKTQVAYVDSALDRVTLLDLATDTPAITTAQIGRNAEYAVPSPDRHRLFVITRGEEAIHTGEIDQDPLMWVLDTQHPDVTPQAYAIGSPFDRVAVSPDNTIAIAYFSAAGPDATGFFRNPNELAVVDLTQPPSDTNPVLKTIRSFGSVPEGIELSPPMVVPGTSDPTPRTFAFILADNNLTVLDTNHPDRNEVSIRLDIGGTAVIPREVVFAPNTASAYVRSDHARDILQVILTADEPTTPNADNFRPQLAELGAGGGPTDIAVYDDASGKRYLLAATPNTGEVVVIDADTAQFRSVPIADPIDRILLFPTGDGAVPTMALLASIGSEGKRLHVLDLAHIQDPLTEARLDLITLDQPVKDVVPVPGRDLAMIVHDDARTVLGLLDMDTQSTSPLLGVGKLDSYDFSPDGSHLIGATNGISRLGFVALDNLHPTDFRLDDPPAHVLSTANMKIFVDHGDPLGHATIIPSPTATRDQAIVLEGFLTADLLDKEP